MSEIASDIRAKFLEQKVDVPLSEIEPIVETLVSYHVASDEIKRSVIIQLNKKYGVDVRGGGSGNKLLKLSELTRGKMSATVRVKFLEEWDNDNPDIRQVGLVGDETGVMRLTVWNEVKFDAKLKEGESYEIKNAFTGEYNKRISLSAGKYAGIGPCAAVESMDANPELVGVLVAIQDGSGLINRCPDCNKVLDKMVCKDHGKLTAKKAVRDIRIKGILDDGKTAHSIIVNAALTEKLTGINVKVAEDMAMEEGGDRSVVEAELRTRLVGRYYRVKGSIAGDYVIVKDIAPLEKLEIDADALMKRVLAL